MKWDNENMFFVPGQGVLQFNLKIGDVDCDFYVMPHFQVTLQGCCQVALQKIEMDIKMND